MNMKFVTVLTAASLISFLPAARAQSSGSDAANPDKSAEPQVKTRRVWDNDSIQTLKGGVNVVGTPSAAKPSTQLRTTAHPAPQLPPGLTFRATTLEGKEITSDSLQGKAVLVQFWTTWCPKCRRDQPALDAITRAFDDDLVVLAVDHEESRDTVSKYLKQNPRSCHVILAKDTDLTALFPPSSYPTYVVIDRNGRIVGTRKGAIGEDGLRRLVARAGIGSD
jgi:thiol-disulfide isomerase/thioredoxin